MFAELNARSNFSFLFGASHPHELVNRAKQLDYQAIAITDECSLSGVVRAYQACQESQLKLIVGSEFKLNQHGSFVLLVTSQLAYQQLCALITLARRRSGKGSYSIELEDLRIANQCLCLWAAPAQPSLQSLAFIKQNQSRCFMLLGETLNQPQQGLSNQRRLAQELGIECLASTQARMHHASRKPLADVLDAIRNHTTVQAAGQILQSNAEQRLLPLSTLEQRFHPQEIELSLKLSQRCQFCLSELKYQYPDDLVPEGEDASDYLRKLVSEGAAKRYPNAIPSAVQAQLKHELELIDEMQYCHYFLTIFDIVRFAKQREILCQGRGSAANSVVCYCLGITEVDPTKVNLLFERFISRERNEPPDIDVDFEHQRREEVIQYIYQKYGRERAALAATIISYRSRSALRQVAKALAIEEHRVVQLLSEIDWRDKSTSCYQKIVASQAVAISIRERYASLVEQLIGFPRHLSQHVGGFVIAKTSLSHLVPVENAAMVDRTIIQWDKDDLEALHLMKVDILALGMLSAIRRCLALMSERDHKTYQLSDIPREDSKTYDMLCEGDSVGVFQIESRAQINMLPRLRPRNYYDLVIEVAIVRPGPIQGDMVHPFLRRRQKLEAVDYPSDSVKSVLERTLGVPIFQEQVIKIAMVAANFSGGEADELRRAMASWKRNGKLDYFKHKLLDGMLNNGYELEFAERLFSQIQGFGEYGFPESHAASFALLVYISSWLKCHEPAAFCCALLNSQPMGFYSPSQLLQDAKRHGVEILPVDINYSHWDSSLVHRQPRGAQQASSAIRLGIRLVKGLHREKFIALLEQRPERGFVDLELLKRHLDATSLESLASADALLSLAGNRHQARWQMAGYEPPLVIGADIIEQAVELSAPKEVESVLQDYRTTGLSLRRHPMAILRAHPKLKNYRNSQQLFQGKHGQLVKVAGLVVGRQRPGSSADVTFVTLEDETGNINVVVWSATAKAQRSTLINAKLMMVHGVLEREAKVIHIIAGKLIDNSNLLEKLNLPSRDFR
ncbi:DNA polymerase III subunit alpha [Alginatibacterium sediminis]|uniref:Error-prone DNA polymerase n=1 Tax=Alginatibacterium sediminis TaxID=2164068 RepID=A0A420E6I7_9ALTE|nr:error-prone DNA polymerase [Alginatibacterium sediminis]RKF13766.1 DNA polymerase III subunit alpha [Alginatibacterium sediminis]